MSKIEDQDARAAIDGAIAFGRMGVNEPPAGHWLTEYWSIGRQLAELGKTSAWDNQTPVGSRPTPEQSGAARDGERFVLLMGAVVAYMNNTPMTEVQKRVYELFDTPTADEISVDAIRERIDAAMDRSARDAGSLTLDQRADISRAAGVLEANDSYFEAGKLRAILATAPRDDTAMLEWLIEKQAWIQWENRDGSILQCQVYDQDEDEEYHILSGEGRYFNTPRDAIRAAMDRSALGREG